MIRYKLYQNKMEGNTGYNLWYARAVCDETYDTEMLAKHMSTHNTPYSPGVIHGVLKDMIACIKELLLDGKNVKLDDLAIFSVGIKSKGAASVAAFNVAEYVSGLKLRARATGNLSTSTLKQDAVVKQLTKYSVSDTGEGGGI